MRRQYATLPVMGRCIPLSYDPVPHRAPSPRSITEGLHVARHASYAVGSQPAELASPNLQPFGDALDLGWCVLRPLDEIWARKVRGVVPRRQDIAGWAAYARLTWRAFLKLQLDRQKELRLGALWMTRQFDRPMIGTPVWLKDRLA